ncbi:MAG: hypothetical protein RMJ56_05430 [Gemmataceae bacterium]|nr:hypothetical protein [Gemmata sp.]MDW8197030.1 hypothetical protein [Gemmataceae bacterium]
MMLRCLLALLAFAIVVVDASAGPLRRRAATLPRYSNAPPVVVVAGTSAAAPLTPATFTAQSSSLLIAGTETAAVSGVSGDGLEEVNAKRAARGLPPFVRDDSLTQAAYACAAFRAQHGLFGHTANDFAFLPAGASASAAGCAAYPASYGWMSCCVYDHYTYAGAAWVMGADGRRYMHLFVR